MRSQHVANIPPSGNKSCESWVMSIEFYFDPISPYAWLACRGIARLSTATGKTIMARPVLFAGLLNAFGHHGPAEIPAKRLYIFRDVLRRASAYGLPVKGPPTHPFNPLPALRTCIAIDDEATRLCVARHVMDAAWLDGLDISREQIIADCLQANGLAADTLIQATSDPMVKKALIDATDHAISLGIFGVPTFRINEQLFWGEDRMDDVIRYCDGQRIDEVQLAHIVARGCIGFTTLKFIIIAMSLESTRCRSLVYYLPIITLKCTLDTSR